MSLFLSRLSLPKLSLHRHITARCFSNCVFKVNSCDSTLRDGDVGSLDIYSYNIDSGVNCTEKKVPMELVKEMGTIGASHGWVATLKNGVVRLQDDLDPCALDKKDSKRISLPPLETLLHCQTQIVTNVAMSTSSPEDEDCIVAIKFMGPQLSLCRPAQKDCKWTNIRITDPGFFSSHVMYSKKSEMFSMPASGGNYIGSWDLGKHMQKPKLQMLWYPEQRPVRDMYIDRIDEFVRSEIVRKCGWGLFDSCCRLEHYLVESSQTGDTFMVKWFTYIDPRGKGLHKEGNAENWDHFPKDWDHFHVLRLDKEGNAVYTEDLGGVCIFLSKAEPFCLPPACLYEQRPNCIYYLDDHNNTRFSCIDDEEYMMTGESVTTGPRSVTSPVPYWFPPKLD